VRLEGLGQLKTPMTSSGIEPAISRLVSWYLNQLHYSLSPCYSLKVHESLTCKFHFCVGFDVLTAVVMKNTSFWDITPRGPLEVNRRFGGAYRLHLRCRRINQARRRKSRWQSVDFQRTKRPYIPEDSPLFLLLLGNSFLRSCPTGADNQYR
jgi:hypothetical protein